MLLTTQPWRRDIVGTCIFLCVGRPLVVAFTIQNCVETASVTATFVPNGPVMSSPIRPTQKEPRAAAPSYIFSIPYPVPEPRRVGCRAQKEGCDIIRTQPTQSCIPTIVVYLHSV